jgi:hypothetical protein
MSKRRDGFVLVSPSGMVLPGTFTIDKQQTEQIAFDFLSRCSRSKWAAHPRYWKQWDKFVAEREKRGWRVVPARVVLA